MSDGKSVVIGAVLGGVLSLGSAWMQGYMNRDKDLAAEKRQKLEMLLEDAFKLNTCRGDFFRAVSRGSFDSECENKDTVFRMLSVSRLYFPELKDDVNEYALEIVDLQKRALECAHSGKTFNEDAEKRNQCVGSIRINNTSAHKLQVLVDKATAVSEKLR